jgi:tetratricopeptide (TPR) repeat protein
MAKNKIYKLIQIILVILSTTLLFFEFDYTYRLLLFLIVPAYLLASQFYKTIFLSKTDTKTIFIFSSFIGLIIYFYYPTAFFSIIFALHILSIALLATEYFEIMIIRLKNVPAIDLSLLSFFLLSNYILKDQFQIYFYIFCSILLTLGFKLIRKRSHLFPDNTNLTFFTLTYYFIIQSEFFKFFELDQSYSYFFFAIPIIFLLLREFFVKSKSTYIQKFTSLILFLIVIFSVFSIYDENKLTESNWKKFAKKVGNESCMPCHADITVSYQHSQMGRSMMAMTESNLELNYDTVNVYDEKNNFYYSISKEDSSFFMIEKRFDNKNNVIHELKFQIDYIVGSGNKTKSFLMVENDFVYEMPVTFYSNKKKWDLSPGYHNYNIRFYRVADQLCMDCHNAKNDFVEHSQNRFTNIPEGIDCEQCHGPASLHIAKQSSKLSINFDPIHNPENSDKTDLVCYDCHPRKILDNLSNDEQLEFTAHSTRLSMSKCYTEGDIKCMDCHDPHLALEQTRSKIEKSCYTCHNASDVVKIVNHAEYDDCTSCHMPKKGSSDIPHVSATDHFITVHDKDLETELKEHYRQFFRQKSISTADKEKAKESILLFRQKIASINEPILILNQAVETLESQLFLESKYEFELAKGYFFQKRYARAIPVFSKLENNSQFDKTADFYFLFGNLYLMQKTVTKAKERLLKALKVYPDHLESLLSLSSIYIEEKNYSSAIQMVDKILALIPFHENALYQKTNIVHLYLNNRSFANKIYLQLFKFHPDHYLGNINYANFLAEGELYSEAIERLETLLSRNVKGEQLEANLIRFYIMNKNKEKAEAFFSIFKKSYPNSVYLKALKSLLNSEF